VSNNSNNAVLTLVFHLCPTKMSLAGIMKNAGVKHHHARKNSVIVILLQAHLFWSFFTINWFGTGWDLQDRISTIIPKKQWKCAFILSGVVSLIAGNISYRLPVYTGWYRKRQIFGAKRIWIFKKSFIDTPL